MAHRINGTRRGQVQKVHSGAGKGVGVSVLPKDSPRHRTPSQKNHIPKSIRTIQPKRSAKKIVYVIDTNVIMNAYDAVLNFKEHTVCITGQVWRELDKHKKGHADSSWNARKAIRIIDALVVGKDGDELARGIPIVSTKEFEVSPLCTGKMVFDFSIPIKPELDLDLDVNHPDDRIIMICIARKRKGERVVLVSNDGNCRVKARLCGVEAEEYLSDAAVSMRGEEDLRTGFHSVPPDFWNLQEPHIAPKRKGSETTYLFTHPCLKDVYPNEFLVMEDETLFRVLSKPKARSVVAMLIHPEKDVWGAEPKNNEQIMALNLLMDPNIPAVSIAGRAGSGKTYLTLAAALEQVFEKKLYDRIIITRPTVSAGEEIGFLPGTEEEKMDPWMGAIHDNLELLAYPDDYADGGKTNKKDGQRGTKDFLFGRLLIKSINFMKGRSFPRTIIIVDESQDLTPKQLKMISTRVGEGSKIVFIGNVAQIDDPYLTEHTCGLSVFIRTFSDSPLVGHVTLQGGVRSPFASLAEERL